MYRNTRNILSLMLLACATAPVTQAASDFPQHALRLIVPFAPGGGADSNARQIAELWSRSLGQTIVIENRPGAGGTLGANHVVKAAPDGYTLLYTTPGQQMTAPYLIKELPYDAFKDLTPIGKVVSGTNVLVVPESLPVNSVQALIDYAKAHPGQLGFASSGVGSSSHLAGELFKKEANIDIFHVPYRGSGPAHTDVIGGQVPMTIDSLSVYLADIRAGKVRALGVSTLERSPTTPDIPSISETLPGFEAFAVNYISAPANTPKTVINKLNKTLNQALSDPQLRSNLIAVGTQPGGSTPKEMEELIHSESQKWKALIESANIKIK